jgi:hypothetical protein
MNVAEVEPPDHITRAAGTLATMTREQNRCREAIQAMTQPPALEALRDTLEQTRLNTPALRVAEQARKVASVTDTITGQVSPVLAIAERIKAPQATPVSRGLFEQCRRIDEAVRDLREIPRIDTGRLSEITAHVGTGDFGFEIDRTRNSIEAFRHSLPDLSGFASSTNLRGSAENWPEIPTQALRFDMAERQPCLHFGIDPVPPRTRDLGVESLAIEQVDPKVPVENQQGYTHIFRLENGLRRFVAAQLNAMFGPGWEKRQVPGEIRKRWCEKQEKARAAGQIPEPLIAYGDLDDYRAIIVRNDNWQAVFVAFFGHKGFVDESFRRLHPPRHTIAHMRPLTADDLELVRVETRLLLQAIGEECAL